MSHPAGLPDLFIDRSLGRIVFPNALRDAGLRVHALADIYGMPEDQSVDDEDWLRFAGERGWVALTKDKRLRHDSSEKKALIDQKVRLFSMTGKNLEADEVARHFLNNLDAITQACQEPGPFVYVVYPDRIDRLKSI